MSHLNDRWLFEKCPPEYFYPNHQRFTRKISETGEGGGGGGRGRLQLPSLPGPYTNG